MLLLFVFWIISRERQAKKKPPIGGLCRDWLSLYAERGSAISSIKEPSGRNTSTSDGRVSIKPVNLSFFERLVRHVDLVAPLGLEPRHHAL